MGPLLDIAANSQEELKEWMAKIREVAMTSEAKVNTTMSQMAGSSEHTVSYKSLPAIVPKQLLV